MRGRDHSLQSLRLTHDEHLIAQLCQQTPQGLQALLLKAKRLTRPLQGLVLVNRQVIGAKGLPASPRPGPVSHQHQAALWLRPGIAEPQPLESCSARRSPFKLSNQGLVQPGPGQREPSRADLAILDGAHCGQWQATAGRHRPHQAQGPDDPKRGSSVHRPMEN